MRLHEFDVNVCFFYKFALLGNERSQRLFFLKQKGWDIMIP